MATGSKTSSFHKHWRPSMALIERVAIGNAEQGAAATENRQMRQLLTFAARHKNRPKSTFHKV